MVGVVPPSQVLAAAAPTVSMVVLFSTGFGTLPGKTMKVTGPSVPPVAGLGSMPSATAGVGTLADDVVGPLVGEDRVDHLVVVDDGGRRCRVRCRRWLVVEPELGSGIT